MYDLDSWTVTAPRSGLEEIDEIREEADEWQITWTDKDPRTTTIAWVVYCARRDSDATVEPMTTAVPQR